jgi:hypothetical protein
MNELTTLIVIEGPGENIFRIISEARYKEYLAQGTLFTNCTLDHIKIFPQRKWEYTKAMSVAHNPQAGKDKQEKALEMIAYIEAEGYSGKKNEQLFQEKVAKTHQKMCTCPYCNKE